MKPTILLVALAPCLVAAGAPAADQGQARVKVVADVVHCRSIADSTARLACYDSAVAALDQAEASHQIVVMDKQEVRKTRRSLFGFSLPKIKIFGGGDDKHDESLDRIDTSVVSLRHDIDNRLVFTTPEGATWHQIDDRPTFAVKRGMKVTIKSAALGSYFADFAHSVPVRVRRDK